MPTVATLALFALLAVGSFVLSCLEAAVSALRDHHFTSLGRIAEKPPTRQAVALARHRRDSRLPTVLTASMACDLGLVATALYLLDAVPPPLRWKFGIALFGFTIIATQVVPKAVALAHPKDTFRRTAPLLLFLDRALGPIAALLGRSAAAAANALLPKNLQARSLLTGEELGTWLDLRRGIGTLRSSEIILIRGILALGRKTAKDCMTPRVDVITLPLDSPPALAYATAVAHEHWCIPVYEGSPDEITAVLDVRAFLHATRGDPEVHPAAITDHLTAPVFAPETMAAEKLFKTNLQDPGSFVIVLDEYGGFEGILTHGDMIEAIFAGAAPLAEAGFPVEPLPDGRLRTDGSVRLDDLGEALGGLDLEHDGLDTIGGLVFTRAGGLPKSGERIDLGHLIATVEKVGPHRIETLILERSSSH